MSLRSYGRYRDSGLEWLGDVPAHWRVEPIRALAKPGRASFVDGDWIEAPFITDHGVRLIQTGNIGVGSYKEQGFRYVSEKTFDDLQCTEVLPGDILICRLAEPVGRACLAPDLRCRMITSVDVCVLKPRPSACQSFLTYFFSSPEYLGFMEGQCRGGTRDRVSRTFLGNVRVVLPTPDEQVAIAAFLDRETAKIDALVEEQRLLVGLLNEKRQAAISRAVTKGLDPSAPMKDSGVEWLGDVPDHWEVTRLANVFREVGEPLADDLPILSVSIHTGVSDSELDEHELDRKVSRSEDRSKYKRVRPGDLAYNMMRAWQGGFGTVLVEGGVSPAYVVARPKTNVETAFVEWILRTPQCVEEMRTRSAGVTDFRLRLYWDEFKNLKIALPPVVEQERILTEIGAEVEHYGRLSEAAEEASKLLAERRAALISAVVTGKIDVRGWTEADVRKAVAAEIIWLNARKPTFGRVKNQKLLYLAETHAGIGEIGGRYERQAAGPYAGDLIELVERDLVALGVMTVSQPDGRGSAVSYSINRSWKPDSERLKVMLGDRLAAFEHVNVKLADLSTRESEAVATLYAVWNDALIDGEACDDARVIRGFLDEWHPEKREKFKAGDLPTWLGWMRRNGFVPKGQGPRTGAKGLFA